MQHDYSDGYYRGVSYKWNRKRQIIDAMLEELHEQHAQMIEDAMSYSDMEEARRVIDYVRGL